MNRTRIVIADDHPIFRSGVREILNQNNDVICIAEAENGLEAYQTILATLPDIAILDLEMPVLSGLDVCKKVLSEKNQTRFILLTMHKEKRYLLDAMQSGVLGYLIKDNAATDLIACIRSVAKGDRYISPQLRAFEKEALNSYTISPELELVNRLLTPTERVILKLISEGKTSAEIAALLFISPNTVDNHRANMARKLQVEGKNSLLKFAVALKAEL